MNTFISEPGGDFFFFLYQVAVNFIIVFILILSLFFLLIQVTLLDMSMFVLPLLVYQCIPAAADSEVQE